MSNITQITPGASVSITAPPIVIAGVQAQVGAVVGTATKGPVNVATAISGNSFESIFGSPQDRKYDGGTVVSDAALASTGGASTLYFTRVTDGSDTAATATINASVLTATSTGSGFNGTVVSFGAGGRANSVTVSISAPGANKESFQNLPATNASVFAAAFDAAINAGSGVLRGPSSIIRANSVAMANVPVLPSSVTLTGGTDGVAGVGSNTLVGSDSVSKSGMYSLRGLGIQYAVLADCDDANTYTTQAAFGEAEFMLMGTVLPSGLASATATSAATKSTMGLDSFNAILLQGDWVSINDTVFGVRKVSPQGFWLGTRASLLPHESVLNKPINGIVGSERSFSGGPYTTPETNTLTTAGIEVIANPIPRGAAWGCIVGRNTSSTIGIQSDSYSTMTNFLAQTLKQAGGPYVGEPNNTKTRQLAVASTTHFLAGLVRQGILALDINGNTPYAVTCDATNNSQDDIVLGNLNLYVQVQYQGIVWYFNVGLLGGSGVTISVTSTAPTS
jgi:hypothetical protein